MSNLDHALDYAAAGLAVLPLHFPRRGRCSCGVASCDRAAKHPIGGNGKDHATTDTATITGWWSRWPEANVGVRPVPGLAVLDVDPRHGGDDTLAALQSEHGMLPETLTAETGSGGSHIWLAYAGAARGVLGPGIDVKTCRGYLVAPPSVHICGSQYVWLIDAPTAAAPAWVRTLLAPPKPTIQSGPLRRGDRLDGLVRTVADAREGNRNNLLFWAACRAYEHGQGDELRDALADAARSIGLAESAITATLDSARSTTGAAT